MLDFFTAIAIFFTIMFFTQEWVLEFRLGKLGRFWSLMSAASLFISAVLCAVIIIRLIVKIEINVLTLTGNLIVGAFVVRTQLQLWSAATGAIARSCWCEKCDRLVYQQLQERC